MMNNRLNEWQWQDKKGGIIVAGSKTMEKITNAMVVVFAKGSGGRWLGSKSPEILKKYLDPITGISCHYFNNVGVEKYSMKLRT